MRTATVMMDDPTLLEEHANTRVKIVRRAALFVPGAVLATALFLVALTSLLAGNMGAIFATVIMALIAFAVDYEALAAVRDLRAQPTTTEGQVARLWSKGRILFFGRVDYLLIDRKVFEIQRPTAMELDEGDRVRIEHWPHTNTVIELRKVPASERSRAAGD